MLFLLLAISILSNRSGTTSRDRTKKGTPAKPKPAVLLNLNPLASSDKVRANSAYAPIEKPTQMLISDKADMNPNSITRPEVYGKVTNGAVVIKF